MRRYVPAIAALVVLGFTGCARDGAVEPTPYPAEARTEARDPGGRLIATATAAEEAGRLRIRVEASGLAPGAYGAHIHAVGRCDPPGFESAGPHWNPLDREHGTQNPEGPHFGDLPNLMVGADGRGSFEFTIPGATLSGRQLPVLDGDGAALVIHAGADDYRTDPSGNSGARIACGVFG